MKHNDMTEPILSSMEAAKESGAFIGVFSDPDRSTAATIGRITRISEEIIAIASVAKDGLNDGLAIRVRSDIFRTQTGGIYEGSVERLWKAKVSGVAEVVSAAESEDLDTVRDCLDFAMRLESVISIWCRQSPSDSTSGTVVELGYDDVRLRIIDDFGKDDGFANVRIGDISAVNIDGVDESRLKDLYLGS